MSGKVLCLTSNFPRWEGDSTTPFVLNLARDLGPLGWDVDVLAPHAPGAAQAEELEGIRVKRFRYLWPESMETVCYRGGALINLRQDKSNYLKLPMFLVAELLATLRSTLAADYDLVHSHWVLPQGFVGLLAARMARLPLVVTVHGGDIFSLTGSFYERFKRYTFQRADFVTVNSRATEAEVNRIAPEVDTIACVPMGVETSVAADPDMVENIRKTYIRGAGPLLVFIGRVVEEKGIRDLIGAVRILSIRFPDVSAMIVGEGQDKVELERYAASLELDDRIHFVGWVQPDSVAAYLRAADVFVGPSTTSPEGWKEGQGLTFLEAMAAEVPVIATRLGGVVDFVSHEQTGMLVGEKSPDQIAEAVIRLIKDEALRSKLVRQAKVTVLERYSRTASASAMAEIFEQVKRG